jgi:hypothetical protein
LRKGGDGQENAEEQMEDRRALCLHRITASRDSSHRCSHGISLFSRLIYILPSHIFLFVGSSAG